MDRSDDLRRFISMANIVRYRGMLRIEADEARRRMLMRLLELEMANSRIPDEE
jgi:hypothetical protein